MAHKHNRRRIRPRSRNRNTLVMHSLFDGSLLSEPGIASDAEEPSIRTTSVHPSAAASRVVTLDPTITWTNRSQNLCIAWPSQTKRQIEEAARLERDRIKLFGG